ncbi:MAG: hypothetical protein R3223_12595, partial [Longimicrobiales bacterium]|nr:hypothetical protein [Longimicrobiales bacterium]
LVGVRGTVFTEAMDAIAFLWPVPLLTGIRAAHQGRLVGRHRTHPIAVATGVRTAVLAGVAFGLTVVTGGAWVGGAAFVLGLLVEASIVGLARAPDSIPPGAEEIPPLVDAALEGGDELLRFSTPLMLNGFLWWSTPLIINAVLARTPRPELALASFAVVEAVAWFVTAPVGQYQHASIALVGDRRSHRKLRRWAGALAAGVFLLLGFLALPWIARPVLDLVFQLDAELLESASSALPVAALYPLLYGHRQYYQGLFVRVGCPGVVGIGAILRVTSLILMAVLLVDALGGYGAAFGVGLHAFGLAVEGGFLLERSRVRVLPALEAR